MQNEWFGIQIKDNPCCGNKKTSYLDECCSSRRNSGDYMHEIFYLKNNKQIENNSPSKNPVVNYPI